MKKNLLIAAFAALLLAANAFAQGNKAKPNPPPTVTDVKVKATFIYCPSGDSGCESINRVRMDTAASYVDGDAGVSAVFNRGSGSEDLTINLITSQRSVWFDFGNPYNSYNNAGQYVVPSWFATPQIVKPHFNVLRAYKAKLECGDAAAGCDYQTAMNAGNWNVDGIEYAMQWNPESTFKAVVNEQGPTSYVNVHYQDNGSGDVFTITPIPTPLSGLPISGLAKTVRKTTSNAGQYVMPFKLVVQPK